MTKRSNQTQFSLRVESLKAEFDHDYLEACVLVADEMKIDLEDIPSLLSPALKDKIEHEAIANKSIKGTIDTGSLSFLM